VSGSSTTMVLPVYSGRLISLSTAGWEPAFCDNSSLRRIEPA
jgi:hypothetical protein